jgi:flagellar secretion chaperone FliS
MNSFATEYLAQEVEGVEPARLTELLYQRAVRDLENARDLWGSEQMPEAIRHVVHAQQILLELQRSLDFGRGGALAHSLGQLYEYMQFRLSESTQQASTAQLQQINEVVKLLGSISDAWSAMLRENLAPVAVEV